MFNRDPSLRLYPDLSMNYEGYVGRIDSIPNISLTKCIILRVLTLLAVPAPPHRQKVHSGLRRVSLLVVSGKSPLHLWCLDHWSTLSKTTQSSLLPSLQF
jgi:hypothetical protein